VSTNEQPHDHSTPHEHPQEKHVHGSDSHDHAPNKAHSHRHDPPTTLWGWIATALHLHGHDESHGSLNADPAFNASEEGIRTVWWALGLLALTTALQMGVVAISGSVALFADTIHNLGDTLNSIPLLIAFYLGRRAPTRRYTYGYGRAEDVAGVFIVISIAISAGIIFWESFQRLLNPAPSANLLYVAIAAVIGFVGNEAVAWLQIRAGRKINSEAMIADGLHARIDGITSLAVLLAAGASALGFPILDPIIGLVIGVTVLFITRDAALRVWYRLMDAVDPKLIDQIEQIAGNVAQVEGVERVRMRWVGHELHADMVILVSPHLDLLAGHDVAHHVQDALQQKVPAVAEVNIHVHPQRE
jgi:cation diffusion facilitator family transporter